MDYCHRKIAAHYIYYRRSLLRGGIVSFSSNGTVTAIETCEEPDSLAGVEFYSGILIPDMANAHCHLELSYLRGSIPEGGGFTGFAQAMGKVRNQFRSEQKAAAADAADALLWKQGVGLIGDICNGTDSFGAKSRSHISQANFIELFGLATTSLAGIMPAVERARQAGLPFRTTPHSLYSLSPEAFALAIGRVEGEGSQLPLSIHFMESPAETELFDQKGPMWEWYKESGMDASFVRSFSSPAERLIRQVSPDRDVMLIHNCCVGQEEVDMITSHFTGRVTWVLCPRSNHYISRLSPPTELLRRKKARIAIGTDSLASNSSLSMIDELKCFPQVPLEELLGWATVNGAQALGLDRGAEFETGKPSGAVIIEGADLNNLRLTPESTTRRII